MTDITLQQCPICRASAINVERKEGILVGEFGCMLTELQVHRHAAASRKEVAQI